MIKQLLKQIWAQRKSNTWLWAELIIVFICLSYVVDYLYTTGTTYYSPVGYNTENVYQVKLSEVPSNSPQFQETDYDTRREQFLNILDRIRTYPGIQSVTVTHGGHPYSMRMSSGLRGIDTVWVHGYVFQVSPDFFEVFQLKDRNDRTNTLTEAATQSGTMIMNSKAESEYREKGIDPDNAGMKNYNGTEPYITVRGVCMDTRFDDFETPYPAYYECFNEAELWRRSGIYLDICVRVNDTVDGEQFFTAFRQDMKSQLRLGNFYLLDINSFKDIRDNYYRSNGKINDVKTYLAGLLFLLLNIFLGVIGTFWVRTQQRRSEIGLRLALGSSYPGIRKLLIYEGLLIMVLAVIPASFISSVIFKSGLVIQDFDTSFQVGRFFIGQLITLVIVAAMIIIGILFPAHQAMKIKPAIALHEE